MTTMRRQEAIRVILSCCGDGASPDKISAHIEKVTGFRISPATIYRWRKGQNASRPWYRICYVADRLLRAAGEEVR